MNYPKGLSHFEEKLKDCGAGSAETDWGRWWQTVQEIHVEIQLPLGTRAKELKVCILPSSLECSLGNKIFIKGKLHRVVKPDDSTWTIEEKRLLRLILCKGDFSTKDCIWTSLLENEGQLTPDVVKEMRKNCDLERFQMEYPGMDFSKAKLAGSSNKPSSS